MNFDPGAFTVTALTSIPGMFAMIVAMVEVLKDAIFWGDNEWRDRLTPILSAIVGLGYGTACGLMTHGDLAASGLIGLGLAMAASGLYGRVVGPVVGGVTGLLTPGATVTVPAPDKQSS